jgi:16S rRNA processing protein RimM
MDEGYIELGIIKRVQGLKGQVVAFLDFSLDTADWLKMIFIQVDHTLVPYRVVQVQLLYDDQAIMKFQGIDDRTMAYLLKGKTLFIRKEDFPEEVFTQEQALPLSLVGYQVSDMQQRELGTVEGIENLPMQTLLVINYLSKELLIPYNPALIHDIDHASKQIVVDLPSGFIEVLI